MALIKDILRTMDYGPAPEGREHVMAWLDRHKEGFGLFVDGRFSKPAMLFDVMNPATGERIARVAQGSGADVDRAVSAARKALAKWSALTGYDRARFLYALARLVQKRERFLSVLESLDNGKPIRESRDIDIPLVARHFYHHAGWAQLVESEFPGTRPVGVCGQIIPWNFPLLMLAWKIAPALAAGATVVLKPAEYTPLTALAFAEICIEAGLPPGVVNIVTGDGTTGAALAAHPLVDKVAFTGSTEVGRLIRKATAGTGKKLSLELGGKSPFVVFEDADLDSAVEGVVDAIWFNQGQVCCAGSRLLVAEGAAEALYAKLRARMAKLRVGDPLDKSTDIGAIVAPVQLERIERLMQAGADEGLTFWRAQCELPGRGSFYPPTLVAGVEPASILAREEIFGPVLVATTFRTPDEAVALANNTRYGLAASVWSENVNRALEIAARIKAGVVWINSTNMFDAASGFGGYRESGFGREGGREGLIEYRVSEEPKGKSYPAQQAALSAAPGFAPAQESADAIDRTAKIYVGGKQTRPDSGYSYAVLDPNGRAVGLAGLGNRKDVRNAVEAAAKAASWGAATGHNRAQVLYYVAENMSARADEFARRLAAMTGASARAAKAEVEAAIRRAFFYAGFADKFDGAVHATRSRFVTLAMNEPWGVMGIVCPNEAPLLAFVSLVMPAIAMGNAVVVAPSGAHPLSATDLYTLFDASDVPAGVVNIV
ncbi:MAG: aldehyde dehydrogenase family protein, partial [Hyphomicrobiales bacterium]|nr:aldehyde dehydrogenase family protein [Hyphomicrobiales bacterium]